MKTKVIWLAARKTYVVRWLDPITGTWRQKNVGKRRRDAEEFRREVEQRLEDGVLTRDMTWGEFRRQYLELHLSGLSEASRAGFVTAANHIEQILAPDTVTDLSAMVLNRLVVELRERGRPDTSIAAYLRAIRAALNWAEASQIIAKAPKVPMPRGAKGVSGHRRSRPITLEEFERILLAVPKVRPDDFSHWTRFLRGLWESGFRVQELLKLSWLPSAGWYVDTSARLPVVRISADAQKSGQDQNQPITRQFWELLNEQEDRSGFCFPLPGRTPESQMERRGVVRIISSIGKKAGVITSPRTGKTATSHDIGRRAFATRVGGKLSSNELAAWMRHASPETTARYYYAPAVDDLARKLWEGDQMGDQLENPAEDEPD